MLAKINWEKFKSLVATSQIKWKFNPPSAPWWGGWWERLIRIIKDLLKRTLKKTHVSFEEMSTILCECEAIVNSRPISQDDEQLIAISPGLLLKGTEFEGAPDLDHLENISLGRHMRYRQRLRQELRRRFRDEYLGQLARHSKTTHNLATVKPGDVVLVASDNQKRLNWPLARVTDIVPGKDGVPRIARLRTANSKLIRPLQRLILLESSPFVMVNDSMQDKIQDAESDNHRKDEIDVEDSPLKEPVQNKSTSLQERIHFKED
ncbi:uncharacterized protein LOC111694002 [Trichogramma pretiosum]|uniref:uncharacterized protein LOC111694002 n=1 Tax=Trichogramma pretiosum TaxID=7493 RepID=UPI000C71990A|nr:uncharacterized protein LOC111694002 [Trichogramma pretiosum]